MASWPPSGSRGTRRPPLHLTRPGAWPLGRCRWERAASLRQHLLEALSCGVPRAPLLVCRSSRSLYVISSADLLRYSHRFYPAHVRGTRKADTTRLHRTTSGFILVHQAENRALPRSLACTRGHMQRVLSLHIMAGVWGGARPLGTGQPRRGVLGGG